MLLKLTLEQQKQWHTPNSLQRGTMPWIWILTTVQLRHLSTAQLKRNIYHF